jgi:hypothetical protein
VRKSLNGFVIRSPQNLFFAPSSFPIATRMMEKVQAMMNVSGHRYLDSQPPASKSA